MSLKAFHIVFITASILLAFGFGAWAIMQWRGPGGGKVELAMGVSSLVAGLGLLAYGKYFLKKLRNVDYL